MFKLEIKDDTEAKALITENITCPITGITYRLEEFRISISVLPNKGCPNKEKRQPQCANCKGSHVASYKECPVYKKQAFRQHWWSVKNHMSQFYAKTRLSHNPRIRHSPFRPINL